jgi:excisionase family DNA binding protein
MCVSIDDQMDATMRKTELAEPENKVSSALSTFSSRLAYGIEGAADALDLSRSRIYELIAAGQIAACKVGKRTIIPATELAAFLDRHQVARLPDVRPGLAPRTELAQSRRGSKSGPGTK